MGKVKSSFNSQAHASQIIQRQTGRVSFGLTLFAKFRLGNKGIIVGASSTVVWGRINAKS